jgi:hypothetical protein
MLLFKTLTTLVEPYDEKTVLFGTAFSMYANEDNKNDDDNDDSAKDWFLFCATTLCHLYYYRENPRLLCPLSKPVFYTMFPSSSAIPYAWLTCDNMGMLRVVQQHCMPSRVTVNVQRKLGQYELAPLNLKDFFGGDGDGLDSVITIQVIDEHDMYVVRSSPAAASSPPPFMLLFTVTTRHVMVRLTLISGTLVEDVPDNTIKYVRIPVYGE